MTHIIKPLRIGFLLFLIQHLPWSADAQDIQSLWETRCQELKSFHLIHPRTSITFSKTPRIEKVEKKWVLEWNNTDILLPPADFKKVYISRGYQDTYDILFAADDGTKISLGALSDEPSEDAFSIASLMDDDIESSLEGKALTRAMYGGPVRISELNMFAFTITPQYLVCRKNDYIQECAMATALVLKSIESPGVLVSAHKGVGRYKGWIEKQRMEKDFYYLLNIIPDSPKDILYQVGYIIPKGSVYQALPLMVGKVVKKDIGSQPGWLNALNVALNSTSDESWEKYVDEAAKQGISKDSIVRTVKNLKISVEHID